MMLDQQAMQELKHENAKLRRWVAECVTEICFNCEEYGGKKGGAVCEKCRWKKMQKDATGDI